MFFSYTNLLYDFIRLGIEHIGHMDNFYDSVMVIFFFFLLHRKEQHEQSAKHLIWCSTGEKNRNMDLTKSVFKNFDDRIFNYCGKYSF